MSVTVSTLLLFSRGKSLEGNTVRTTKEKYSSVCVGNIKGVGQWGELCSGLLLSNFMLDAVNLFIAFLRPVKKRKEEKKVL